MGDLVLTDDEVGPVMAKLQEGNVEVTAVHNHLLHETPRVLYMHIHGHGDPATIASALHAALILTKTPMTPAAAPASAPAGPTLDTAMIAATLGQSGKLSGVVYQVAVPRVETIHDAGMEVPSAMGVATSINIQPTAPGKAVATGDFVLTASEVNPVIQALTQNGIAVTAVHSHMLTEDPRLFFMHFWGDEDVAALTRGLRAALDKTNSRRHTASREPTGPGALSLIPQIDPALYGVHFLGHGVAHGIVRQRVGPALIEDPQELQQDQQQHSNEVDAQHQQRDPHTTRHLNPRHGIPLARRRSAFRRFSSHDVLVADNAEDVVAAVNHRQQLEVVFRKQVHDILRYQLGIGGNGRSNHQLFQRRGLVRQHQLAQVYHTQ
jgi:hypothetical protein